MPTLDWIGKQAVVNHDKDIPFRLLKRGIKLSVGDSQNLIIKAVYKHIANAINQSRYEQTEIDKESLRLFYFSQL